MARLTFNAAGDSALYESPSHGGCVFFRETSLRGAGSPCVELRSVAGHVLGAFASFGRATDYMDRHHFTRYTPPASLPHAKPPRTYTRRPKGNA